MIEMVINATDLNMYSTSGPDGIPHSINYTQIIDSLGSQIVDRFLIIGLVFLVYSYWNRCGMRRDFNGPWDSYPKQLMVRLFKDKAEQYTNFMNGFLDGLTSSVAIVAIAMWIMYKLGW